MDLELSEMIDKLTAVQVKLGGKQNVAIIGDDGKVDKFSELKITMTERLLGIRKLLDRSQKSGDRTEGGAKEAIECQAQIRRELITISEEWDELNRIFQIEAKKRRSKYSAEELSRRRMMVGDLQLEIKNIKDIQRSGFITGYQSAALVPMAESELFRASNLDGGGAATGAPEGTGAAGGGGARPGGGRGGHLGVSGGRNNDMTGEQRRQLQLLKDRDREIDREIELVGEGVDQLKVLAQAQNQEVRLQNRMLSTLEERMEEVQDHVITVNERMKTTLAEARSGDKICVDIVCILILIGLISVLYSLTK
ncbi:unnamed protein product [Ectocarpus fasciculatus]